MNVGFFVLRLSRHEIRPNTPLDAIHFDRQLMTSWKLLIFNSPPLFFPTATSVSSFNFKLHYAVPEIRISGGAKRMSRVIPAAGQPSTSSYVFAFALPLSLLAATTFVSLGIADKLDKEYLQERAIDESIRKAEEEIEGEEEGDIEFEEEEVEAESEAEAEAQEAELPRTRNRPKREVEALD